MCRARIVVDHRESAFAETGDLIIPLRQGLIAGADMHGELGEILLGKAVGRTSVSMGALKPASDFFPCIAILHHSPRQMCPFFPSILEGTRPVSVGPAAPREWALQKLVGASPPHAERDRPARHQSEVFFLPVRSWLSLSFRGLSALLSAPLSLRR